MWTMAVNWKEFAYAPGQDAVADKNYEQAVTYGKVKLGSQWIFWKDGMHRCAVSFDRVKRVFRRINEVKTKICCCTTNFDTQSIVLVLDDGRELVLKLGDGLQREGEEIFAAIKRDHPGLKFTTTE